MMLSPCGPSAVPIGGAGVALPAGICSRMTVLTFFLPTSTSLAQPLDLERVELDGRLAPEHVDKHLELALLGVHLGDLAMEVRERTVGDTDGIAGLFLHRPLGRRLRLHLLPH